MPVAWLSSSILWSISVVGAVVGAASVARRRRPRPSTCGRRAR